jgi:hypothetical protein
MCRHNGQVGNSLFCRLKCKECEAEPPVVMTEYHRKVICNIEGGAGKSVQINHLNEGIQLVRSKRHYFFVSQASPSSALTPRIPHRSLIQALYIAGFDR